MGFDVVLVHLVSRVGAGDAANHELRTYGPCRHIGLLAKCDVESLVKPDSVLPTVD